MDWLRVIVFGLLIFYHVGMFFVPWGWHIKNNMIYDNLRWPMLFLNQWRLPILFVISGMGTYFALSYRSGGQFAWERILRLGLPLIFGMLVIVPPQVYIERLADGDFAGGYFSFWPVWAFDGIYPVGNLSWHHLWFLPYLLVFSLILLPVFLWIRRHPKNKLITSLKRSMEKQPYTIYWLIIPLYFYEALLEPFFDITHNLTHDWFNFISSLTLFFYGFLIIALGQSFWDAIVKIRKQLLVIGIIAFSTQLVIWLFFEDSFVIHFTEAFFKVANFWTWILVIFAFGFLQLNRPSKLLQYCNTAVYPFYILHQTIIIVLAYWLMNKNWSLTIKFPILAIGTFLVALVIYEFLIRRIFFVRPFFGLKKKVVY